MTLPTDTLRIDNVRVWGGSGTPTTVTLRARSAAAVHDAAGAWLVPAFVDLACDPGFPGFPTREDPTSLGAAALAGGFADLVTSPAQEPVFDTPEHFAELHRSTPSGARLWPLAALTRRLEGKELSEHGLLARVAVCGLSDGGRVTEDTVVLRNALEYARAFGLRVWLRPADPWLDALGVVHESELSARIGLRGNPAAAEEIGVARVISLVRATGAAVHLSPLSTGTAVAQVRAARLEGLPVTAAVAARSLLLDEDAHAAGRYDTRLRLHPPLRSSADRLALIAGVRDETVYVCADHAPRAPEEKELEFERAVPGSTGLESAFSATLTALDGDLDATVRALSIGPRRLLRGLPAGAASGLALVDPDTITTVSPEHHRSRARNDALVGVRVRGVVRGCFPDAQAVSG